MSGNAGVKILGADGQPLKQEFNMASLGRSLGGLRAPLADEVLLPIKGEADENAELLSRTHGIASGGVQLHIDNIVGHLFRPRYRLNAKRLGLDEDECAAFCREAETLFLEYGEDPACWLDAERRRTFTMMMREAAGNHCRVGEIMAKAEWVKSRPYRTAIKMISSHRVSNPGGAADDESQRGGCKIGEHGESVGYWLQKSTFSGLLAGPSEWSYQPRELANGRANFLHVFEPTGDGQTRAPTQFLSVISRLKLLDKFQETRLENAVVNAMYAATIESELGSTEILQMLQGGDDMRASIEKHLVWLSDYYKHLRPGSGQRFAHLLPGEKLNFNSPGNVDNGFSEFEQSILRYIAAGLGVSYEQLARDYSNVSYSAARASINESWRFFMGRRKVVISRFASMIFSLWLEDAINLGTLKMPGGKTYRDFLANRMAWTKTDWIGTGRLSIDGIKEVKEAILRIEAGLSTYEKELANMGEDYEEIFDQQMRELKMREDKGLPKPSWVQAEAVAPSEQEAANV